MLEQNEEPETIADESTNELNGASDEEPEAPKAINVQSQSSFVEVQHGQLSADSLLSLLCGGASFIVERAGGTAIEKCAIDVLSHVKYATMRASEPILGSVDQQTLVERLHAGSQNRYIIDESPADGRQPFGLLRSEDDPFFQLAQSSHLLQFLWVGRGQFQRDGVLVDTPEGCSGSQLVAFTMPPSTATPMHADHQLFTPDGV